MAYMHINTNFTCWGTPIWQIPKYGKVSDIMCKPIISKILLVFKHMGLSAYNTRTFLFHQNIFLFPAVLNYWEHYQAGLIEKIKHMIDAVGSGDGQFDSMGHSAKYGVYTMSCNTILTVVHFELFSGRWCCKECTIIF